MKGKQQKRKRELVLGGDPNVLITMPDRLAFDESEYAPAELAAKIGPELISTMPCFETLKGAAILYLWKRKGPEKPRRLLGKCQRPTGLLAHFCGADFIVWFAANNCASLTTWQFEALVFHELKHAKIEKNEAIVVPHDWEGFAEEIARYGFWKRDIELIAEVTAQALSLPFEPAGAPEVAPASPVAESGSPA